MKAARIAIKKLGTVDIVHCENIPFFLGKNLRKVSFKY